MFSSALGFSQASSGHLIEQDACFVSSVDGSSRPYWLQIPAEYTPSRKYPLLIFLVGWGGSIYWARDATTFDEEAADREWFMAAYYGGDSWMNQTAQQDVLDMIDAIKSGYSIDASRIYITGSSMGGGGAMTFTANNPDMVAAVADIFGVSNFTEYYYECRGDLRDSIHSAFGGTPEDVPFTYQRYSSIYTATNFLNVPVYITHGDRDRIINVRHSRNLHNLLLELGVEVIYDEVPGAGHSSTLINDHVVPICDFFESHVLNVNPTNIMITADESGGYYWAHIVQEDPSRFAELNASRTPDIVLSEENVRQVALNLTRMGIDPMRKITFSLSWTGKCSVVIANYVANSTKKLEVYVSLNGSACSFVYDGIDQALTIDAPHSADRVSATFVVKCDSDGDGLLNDEEYELGTDPLNPDTDGDGLTDYEETLHGTDPLSSDTDGDGLLDGDEIRLGTDPLKVDTDGDLWDDPVDLMPTNPWVPNVLIVLGIAILVALILRFVKKSIF